MKPDARILIEVYIQPNQTANQKTEVEGNEIELIIALCEAMDNSESFFRLIDMSMKTFIDKKIQNSLSKN